MLVSATALLACGKAYDEHVIFYCSRLSSREGTFYFVNTCDIPSSVNAISVTFLTSLNNFLLNFIKVVSWNN